MMRRRRRRFTVKRSSNVGLNLTPMMDMFTIILVFLLKAMSVTYLGLRPDSSIELPISRDNDAPKRYVSLDISPQGIFIERQAVIVLDRFSLPSGDVAYETLYPLRAVLKNKLERGEIDSTRALIRAHKDTPFDLVWRVMYTARQLGFEQFDNLATREKPS